MVQRVRDEAHRVAISYQRGTRKKSLRTELTDIPGVGEGTAKVLLKHFKSVTKLKQATREQILEVDGVGPTLADAIHAFLSES